jgi:hypothetical protein
MAKKVFTVVLEFTVDVESYSGRVGETVLGAKLPAEPFEATFNRSWLQQELTDALDGSFAPEVSFRFMEVVEAPYGPQNGPNGVFLKEVGVPDPLKYEVPNESADIT